MAMYRAYFDESTGNDSPILVVAGFLADDRLWGRCGFRSMWAPDSSGCGHRKRSDVGSDCVAMWAEFRV